MLNFLIAKNRLQEREALAIVKLMLTVYETHVKKFGSSYSIIGTEESN